MTATKTPKSLLSTNKGLTLDEEAAPATPASGKVLLYAKADGKLYSKDDTGTESALGGGEGTLPVFIGSSVTSQAMTYTTPYEFKINYGTEDLDTIGCYNPTTSRYTPNVAGYYKFGAYANISPATAATGDWVIILYKNGAWEREVARASADSVVGSMLGQPRGEAVPIYMNGTSDYIEFYLAINEGCTILAGECWGYKVG